MFKVDNNERREELIRRFSEAAGDNIALVKCFRNKLEFGSRYPNSIEQQIESIRNRVEMELAEPPWLHLID